MTHNTKILMVEDNEDHAELIGDMLEGVEDSFPNSMVRAATLKEGVSLLRQDRFDAILLDLRLPDADYDTVIKTFLEFELDIPVIALSSMEDLDIALIALRRGLQDYISKTNLEANALVKSIRFAMERKVSQQELREKNEDLEAFSRALANDFDDHLRRINSLSSLVLEYYSASLNEEGKNCLESLQGEAHQLHDLVHGLTEYIGLNIDYSGKEMIDLNEFLPKVISNVQSANKTACSNFRFSELHSVYCVPGQLFHVLFTLLNRSLQILPDEKDGVVYIATKSEFGGTLVSVRSEAGFLDEEARTQMFQPFAKHGSPSEAPRMGLELAIVRRIVERFGGRIAIESEHGSGVTVSFWLPGQERA